MKKTIVTLAAAAFLLSACADSGYGAKQTGGGLIGAAGGGLLGAQFGSGSGKLAATAAGVLLGAFLGSEIGRSMDDVDKLRARQAMTSAQSAPIGQAIKWNNPNSGHSGQVVAVRDGTDPAGAYCREFQETVNIGGKQEQAFGRACRQPDGSWKIVN